MGKNAMLISYYIFSPCLPKLSREFLWHASLIARCTGGGIRVTGEYLGCVNLIIYRPGAKGFAPSEISSLGVISPRSRSINDKSVRGVTDSRACVIMNASPLIDASSPINNSLLKIIQFNKCSKLYKLPIVKVPFFYSVFIGREHIT